MSRISIVLATFILMLTFGPATHGISECKNETIMLPVSPMKAASKPRDFISFKYAMSTSDSILIQSHEDTETTIGPYDLGFLIRHDGRTVRSVSLQKLSEFRREDSFFSEAFMTVAVSSACTNGKVVYFVTMKYMGDEISPALVFVIVPSPQGYKVSALPMFSGGTVEVSKTNPYSLRVWDNLHEGECNACETAYQITEYEIRDGKPIRTKRHRTRHLYSSGQFEDSRIRFIP